MRQSGARDERTEGRDQGAKRRRSNATNGTGEPRTQDPKKNLDQSRQRKDRGRSPRASLWPSEARSNAEGVQGGPWVVRGAGGAGACGSGRATAIRRS